MFSKIKENFSGFKILDGTNFSDTCEYRPGLKALEELNVISPFKDNQIEKKDIVNFLNKEKKTNLISLSATCLATRINFNIDIEKSILKKIELCESFLESQGIFFSRVRLIDKNSWCLETTEDYYNKLLNINKKSFEKILKTDSVLFAKYKKGRFDPPYLVQSS